MTTDHQPFDPGLQAERTLLAWRRTALALAVVSAAGIRFAVPAIGWVAVPVGAVGIALAMLAYIAMGRRYHRVRDTLTSTSRYPSTGWPPAAAATATVLLGVGALIFLAHQI